MSYWALRMPTTLTNLARQKLFPQLVPRTAATPKNAWKQKLDHEPGVSRFPSPRNGYFDLVFTLVNHTPPYHMQIWQVILFTSFGFLLTTVQHDKVFFSVAANVFMAVYI